MRVFVYDIDWDVDEDTFLPNCVNAVIDNSDGKEVTEAIGDYLSNEYENCVNGFHYRIETEKEDLIRKGYRPYNPIQFDPPGIVKRYQKRFRDDKGTKYFIDAKEWEPMIHPRTGEVIFSGFEYETQLYRADTHDAVDIEFHNSWTIDLVEEHLEKMFETGLFDYYELD